MEPERRESRNPAAGIAARATPFELLFDLVFVFTITQVTHVVTHEADTVGIYRAVVLLALVYCIYDGYIWLMNQAPPAGAVTRVVLLVAMAGFLIVAVAIPTAFEDGQWTFSITFLAVILIHHVLFVVVGSPANAGGILRTGPFNLVAAIILVASGLIGESGAAWLYPVALAVILASVLSNRRGGFDLRASHLIERHGLLMIIAFGESIVTVGATLTKQSLDPSSLTAASLTVGVVGGLWWTYFFTGDVAKTEQRVQERDAARRGTLAITAFYGDHLGMMIGLVLFAAGSGLSVGEADHGHSVDAGTLAGIGVAIFFFSQALYRVELRLGHAASRLVGGLVAVAIGIWSVLIDPLTELTLLLITVAGVVSWAPLLSALIKRRSQARQPTSKGGTGPAP